ncbi:DUF6265 family protein [Flavobacterium sp.]|jgi:hypothetical protein|uniref:DUF6265 family protein n=1 Tax=Flavobacterium sp. TaxID=239 RepID=UPI003BC22B43
MKKILFSLLILVLMTSVSCNKYDAKGNLIKKYDELQKAYWLLGEWEKTDSLGILKEIWINKNDSTFIGQSYYIQNNKDTIHNETIELVQDQDYLIYLAMVKGENNNKAIPFQMTKDGDSLLVFENPKHDYPNKIEYRLLKNKSLSISISGKEKGKRNSETYLLVKKK